MTPKQEANLDGFWMALGSTLSGCWCDLGLHFGRVLASKVEKKPDSKTQKNYVFVYALRMRFWDQKGLQNQWDGWMGREPKTVPKKEHEKKTKTGTTGAKAGGRGGVPLSRSI